MKTDYCSSPEDRMADELVSTTPAEAPAEASPGSRPLAGYVDTAVSGVRFTILSVCSAVATFGITVGLHELLAAPERIAYLAALCFVMVMNFLGCRYFVYPGRHRSARREFFEFLMASLAFRGTEYVVFAVLVIWIPYQFTLLMVMGASFVTKFFFYRSNVFATLPEDA